VCLGEEKCAMNQENPHLSYSQVSQYLQCPLKYRFSYVDCLEPEFTPAALAFGAAMHSAIDCFLQSTLEASPFRPDQLLDIYHEEWK
jgi:putative RecB family exonuclease